MIKTITVIGPNTANCTQAMFEFSKELGKFIIDKGYSIVNGGMQGVMEGLFIGAKESNNYREGMTIGILPSSSAKDANAYCDIIIPTGIGYARNQIVVNSSDIVIAIAGGAGTLSEISYAWQQNKKIICFDLFEGWAKELAGMQLDKRNDHPIMRVSTLSELSLLI